MRTFYIVSSVDMCGNLEPAETPRTFNSYKQARFVAYTMAEKHGKEFVVFQAVFAAIPATVKGVYLQEAN